MGGVGSALTNDDLRRSFEELGFMTGSAELLPLLRQVYKAACVSDITVLLEGETGTGKQVLAFAIHRLDQKRRSFPFVTMHCGSLSETLAESELFGHLKGAFTGANSHRQGLFQAADGGTLFLDDVNDLPLHVQVKLLDVLQRGVVRTIGSDRETPVDVRIIAASNQLPKPLVLLNRFRSDLYHRLNVVRLWLPPLRDRMQDLPNLVLAFAYRHRDIYQPIEKLEPELVRLLQSQSYPGNVRELENDVQRMLFSKVGGTSLESADWYRRLTEAEREELDCSGFVVESLETIPYTSAQQHEFPEMRSIAEQNGYPCDLRDACILVIAHKAGAPTDRFPAWLYDR